MIYRYTLLPLLLVSVFAVQAFELTAQKVTGNIYALVGEVGPRTAENLALNNTMGFVVTDAGVVLVSPGASPSGAQLIEQAIKRVTQHPIRLVINIGAQDHHWLGNNYFVSKGAEVFALKRTVLTQKQHVDDHLARLKQLFGKQAESVLPTYATTIYDSDHSRFKFGGVDFELIWPGDSHFPGDGVLWMPQKQLVFTGDLVYLDRMLGVQEVTSTTRWQKAFHKMAALKPTYVIAGHGQPGDLDKAKRDTGNYLDLLVSEITS
ncbi:MAG: MBL fold metallo-hydrolase, partial [Gammaproteobacteria bacterium]|nr:MBL fold metallo-hydrolase [Gammaproteobacteria bacterium]